MDGTPVEESAAAKALEYCNRIFLLERIFEGHGEGNRLLTAEERYVNRQKHSKPVLDEFFAWLSEIHPAGGTKLARAVQYCMNEKAYLYRFLENGSIPVDNNRAENAIRPFVVGRKNWLFSTSPKGAKASAILYSVAATACANDLNIEEYFAKVLRTRGAELLLPR